MDHKAGRFESQSINTSVLALALELLLPDGQAKSRLVMSGDTPAEAAGERDLIICAMPDAKYRRNRSYSQAADIVASELTQDGLAYLLAPPNHSATLKRSLRRKGLSIAAEYLHFPNPAAGALLVPRLPGPARYAFSELLKTAPWKSRLGNHLVRIPGGLKLLGSAFPSVGIIARRPGAQPLLDWLSWPGQDDENPGAAILQTSWRGQAGALILYRFPGAASQPAAIAKVVPVGGPNHPGRETENLIRLGPSAQRAGARVPHLLEQKHFPTFHAQVMSPVFGLPAAVLLQAKPGRLAEILEQVTGWIERWNRSTLVRQPMDGERLEREILSPAKYLAPFLEAGQNYLDWLEERCMRAAGAPFPLVAAHQDLTTWNVLRDEEGGLGILDWEAAREDALPLGDFFYFAVDAALSADRPAGRLAAFESCFSPGGSLRSRVAKLEKCFEETLGISTPGAELCFHAAWLLHAFNEAQQSSPEDGRPFLQIARRLASHPHLFQKA